MSLSRALTVARKELRDNLRDRRSVMAALMYSLFGPLLVAVMLSTLSDRLSEPLQVEVAIAGAEQAPNLVAFLEQQGATVVPTPADLARAVRSGELSVALDIDQEYDADYRRLTPAVVRVLHDSADNDSKRAANKLEGWITSYGQQVASLRLVSRGLDPMLIAPIEAQQVDFASAMSRGARVIGALPIFLILATFIGGMHVAIDVTAGERERGSLETLLAHATPSSTLALGKWAATVMFNAAAVVLTLAISVIVFNAFDFSGFGVTITFGKTEALAVLAILAPLVLMVPALQMTVAIFSRNFKEAQTYLSLLLFVPMLPGFMLQLGVFDDIAWLPLLPILGQEAQLFNLVRGQAIDPAAFWTAAGATLVATFLLIHLAGALLGRETIVLAR